ncbi:MarR family transcriptional regulator [Paracoccus tegillarcae]|uniref:HTH marR-type domain-containing protein n=1 Tax=Paracoccus tegillarcae TaxID=1529068 RepID=A0A2K9F2F8_9RHOB|nr:helix-turn-helix domain-containing protein [Paracoccus tegillarcae]AUH35724.1 hypothetical protein CUV01_19265 [Paracoccus tegillarcae]
MIYSADMSDLEEYWFDPPEVDDPAFPPLPRADRRVLLDPAAWRAAEKECADALANAAMAIGRLDGLLAGLDETLRAGMIPRLALTEVEAMLWAAGTPIAQEVLIRDLADAPAKVDLEALSQARWAIGRLQGRGRLDDLRDFLGLHRAGQGRGDSDLLRLIGKSFEDEAEGFAAGLAEVEGRHAITRAAHGLRLWRLTDLSPDGHQLESAVWAARRLADGTADMVFVPMGQAGRAVWMTGGKPDLFLASWYRAISQGCLDAAHLVRAVSAWADQAQRSAASFKGANAGKVIAALVAAPVLSAMDLERETGLSRDTTVRLVAKLQDLGLVREITGGRRYRFWTAQL